MREYVVTVNHIKTTRLVTRAGSLAELREQLKAWRAKDPACPMRQVAEHEWTWDVVDEGTK